MAALSLETPWTPYPLTFDPLLRAYRFGGRALAGWGKALPPNGAAESWEVSPYPGLPGRIAAGALAGGSLQEASARWPGELGSAGKPGFPFLLKILDVASNLPVHVHPSDAQACDLPGRDPGKEEAWLVLEAEPDAVVHLGFLPGATAGDIADLARAGRAAEAMQAFAVRAGDAVLVPPGTAHAARGIVFLEVQQVSDRSIFADPRDVWGAPWPEGRFERELETFLRVARIGPAETRPVSPAPLGAGRLLAAAGPHFSLERVRADGTYTPRSGPVAVTNLGDPTRMTHGVQSVSLGHGQSVVLPRSLTGTAWQILGAAPADLAESGIATPAELRREAEAAMGAADARERLAPLFPGRDDGSPHTAQGRTKRRYGSPLRPSAGAPSGRSSPNPSSQPPATESSRSRFSS